MEQLTTLMSLAALSFLVLPFHWQTISLIKTLGSLLQLSDLMLLKTQLSISLKTLPLCYTLMNTLRYQLFPQCPTDQLCQHSQQIHGQPYLMIHAQPRPQRYNSKERKASRNASNILFPQPASRRYPTMIHGRCLSHLWGEGFNDGNAQTRNDCCQESNRFHQPRPNSSDCRRLSTLCSTEEMSMGIPWRGQWIKNDVLHGPPAHRNDFTRMWGETAGWIWLGTDVLHSRRLHSWCCSISTRWQACKRTRYAYQLTFAWLNAFRMQAYDEYCHDGCGPHEPIEMWEKWLISLLFCSDDVYNWNSTFSLHKSNQCMMASQKYVFGVSYEREVLTVLLCSHVSTRKVVLQ